MDALSNLGINPGYLLMQIILISILALVLGHFLYKPILNTLEERKERIAKGLEDARQAAIARDNADAEAKKILDAARAEAAKIRQNASEQAEETRTGILREAEAEAQNIVAEARQEAEEERNRVLSDLRSQVVSIAMAAANKLVEESLDPERQRKLISEFLAAPPPDVRQLRGTTAVVTSALPLTPAEKERIRELLPADSVEFRVNPDILGGLIIRVGDQVVDDSVAHQMGELRESLGA